jgi:hypothetical protein
MQALSFYCMLWYHQKLSLPSFGFQDDPITPGLSWARHPKFKA